MTNDYDQSCAEEFARLQTSVERYFVEVKTDCPYDLPYIASFYQAMFGPLGDRAMELFLAAGYRRNGNCLYTMHCQECLACIPIRLQPKKFKPNRNQKRALKKNSDLEIIVQGVTLDEEHLGVCNKFLTARYSQEYHSAQGYYSGFFCNTIVDSMRLEFRLGERLLGGSIVDVGSNWMNAVYFYFDPQEAKRSLGTFNILTLIGICLEQNIDYLYLGYYIEEVSGMSYKKHFRPHELYINNQWLEVVR